MPNQNSQLPTEQSIQRKLRMASALMQQQMPQGRRAGRIFVAPSALETAAGLAQFAAGSRLDKRAGDDQAAFDEAKKAEMATALAQATNPEFRLGDAPQASGAIGAMQHLPVEDQRAFMRDAATMQYRDSLRPEDMVEVEDEQGQPEFVPRSEAVGRRPYRQQRMLPVQHDEGPQYVPESKAAGMRPYSPRLNDGSPDIGRYNPRDYTVDSWSRFLDSNDPGQLERYEAFSTFKDDTGSYVVDRSTGATNQISSPEALGQGQGVRDVEAERVRFQQELPTIVEQANTTLRYVDELEQHPGFNSAVGMSLVPDFLPATDKQGFIAREEQLKSGAFLEGVSALQGLGALSDAEGKKAGDAISRMNRSTKESEYRDALEDYREIIRLGIRKAYRKAGVEPPPEWSGVDHSAANRTATGVEWSIEQ